MGLWVCALHTAVVLDSELNSVGSNAILILKGFISIFSSPKAKTLGYI